MKTKEVKHKKKDTFIIDFTINPELNGKYDNDLFFKEEAEKAKEFIKKAGIPRF